MRLALIGATGMVGEVMQKVLVERRFPVTEFIPVASAKSVGNTLNWNGASYLVRSLAEALAMRPDLVLMSAGGSISL